MHDFILHHSDTLYYYIAIPFAAFCVSLCSGYLCAKSNFSRTYSTIISAVVGVSAVLLFELCRYSLSLYWNRSVSLDSALSLGMAGVMFIALSFFLPLTPIAAAAGGFLGYSLRVRKKTSYTGVR